MTALVEYSPSSESTAAERPRGLRIAQVLTRSDTVAGAQVHVRDLSMALKSRGHEVTVLVGGNGPFCEDLRRNEIPYRSLSSLVRSIDPVHDPLAMVELRRCFKELQPDLVATHSSKAGWLVVYPWSQARGSHVLRTCRDAGRAVHDQNHHRLGTRSQAGFAQAGRAGRSDHHHSLRGPGDHRFALGHP